VETPHLHQEKENLLLPLPRKGKRASTIHLQGGKNGGNSKFFSFLKERKWGLLATSFLYTRKRAEEKKAPSFYGRKKKQTFSRNSPSTPGSASLAPNGSFPYQKKDQVFALRRKGKLHFRRKSRGKPLPLVKEDPRLP